MARGVNSVILLGHLTNDAKQMKTPNGNIYCRFVVAASRWIKRRDQERGQEETAFVQCVFWNSENVFPHLLQGRQVSVTGHLQTWTNKEDKTVLEVNVDDLILTDNKPRNGDAAQAEEPGTPTRETLETYIEQLQDRNRKLQERIDEVLEREAAKPARTEAETTGKRPPAKGKAKTR